jgi:hypothetical protein
MERNTREENRIKTNRRVTDVSTDEDDGFKSTRDREVIYGPFGIVLEGLKWIFEKLYIIKEP